MKYETPYITFCDNIFVKNLFHYIRHLLSNIKSYAIYFCAYFI